jgi:osmoprotectant transport system ATP-binding protein
MISFENVTKKYEDGTYAVKDLNLHINEGEFFVLIGPSGSGKTTTLKMINRMVPNSEGLIKIKEKEINEYNIHELRWDIGYVLQNIALFPHMTIEENIAVVPEMKKWETHKINQRIDELLNMVGLEPATYRKRKPHELSGGQQQRVGVARALAANPPIILMDEPFSALDPITRGKLQDDILQLQTQIKKTIVFVTHDMTEALKLGDRICLMRNGKVVQTGTPEELRSEPVNDFVRDFVSVESPGETKINIRDGILPYEGTAELDAIPRIAPLISMPELVSLLSVHETLAVEESGELIGTIDRQGYFRILSSQMEVSK